MLISRVFIFLVLLFFQSMLLLANNNEFEKYYLDIILKNNNDINFKVINEDSIIKATLKGKVEGLKNESFNNANIDCDLIGRSYQGRSFSCGFAEVEDLNGFCTMISPNAKDVILVDWKCTTTAGMIGDAVCKGKLNVLKGFGKYAGVVGYGNFEMPLIKEIKKKKISIPIKMQINLKIPMQLKSN